MSSPHDTTVAVPEHLLPEVHGEHEWRWVGVPPAVKLPATQVAQVVAPVEALYVESLPQSTHAVPPALTAVPRGQRVMLLVPEHADPARHGEHVARVFAVFPAV